MAIATEGEKSQTKVKKASRGGKPRLFVENLSGDKYFGNIKSSNTKGGFSREGLGCYRRKNGDCYLGSYETSYRMGYGMVKENGAVSFGKFFFDEKDGVFFERNED